MIQGGLNYLDDRVALLLKHGRDTSFRPGKLEGGRHNEVPTHLCHAGWGIAF